VSTSLLLLERGVIVLGLAIAIAALGVGAGADPALAPLTATYVLILAVTGPLVARLVDPRVPVGVGGDV
jgi:hypothetical protein